MTDITVAMRGGGGSVCWGRCRGFSGSSPGRSKMESDLVAGVGAMIPLEPCQCNLEQGIGPPIAHIHIQTASYCTVKLFSQALVVRLT